MMVAISIKNHLRLLIRRAVKHLMQKVIEQDSTVVLYELRV